MSLPDHLHRCTALVDQRLSSLLRNQPHDPISDNHPSSRQQPNKAKLPATKRAVPDPLIPERLLNAMRHAVLPGGKRLRPFLVLQSAALFGVPDDQSLATAAALELLHCYSLVHDDLPAMDDDDLRRGQPTVHVAFDDWTAILAGDALLTLAFETLADPHGHPDPIIRAELVLYLARAAGGAGMVGGQQLDLDAQKLMPQPNQLPNQLSGQLLGQAPAANDSRSGAAPLTSSPTTDQTRAHIKQLQAMKTGALIRFACEAGAILGRAADDQRLALCHYGTHIGAAFQISDDLLDAQGDQAIVGKAVGKDAAAGKATLVSLAGIDAAKTALRAAENNAIKSLKGFGPKADILREAVAQICHREK